jgi:hypothetical protein
MTTGRPRARRRGFYPTSAAGRTDAGCGTSPTGSTSRCTRWIARRSGVRQRDRPARPGPPSDSPTERSTPSASLTSRCPAQSRAARSGLVYRDSRRAPPSAARGPNWSPSPRPVASGTFVADGPGRARAAASGEGAHLAWARTMPDDTPAKLGMSGGGHGEGGSWARAPSAWIVLLMSRRHVGPSSRALGHRRAARGAALVGDTVVGRPRRPSMDRLDGHRPGMGAHDRQWPDGPRRAREGDVARAFDGRRRMRG